MTTDFPAAILWDMDGTLVDTEPYWMTAEIELVREFGGEWSDEKALQLVGNGLWDSAAIFQEEGVDLDADTIVSRLTASVQAQVLEQGVPWRPGALELLTEAHRAGVKMALVTMSIERMARQILDLLHFDAFDLLVTGDMVENAKPHPEPYLLAAERLGVNIAECIAIEDSVPGVTSAVASGARVIAIPHIVPIPPGDGYLSWPTLGGVTLTQLIEATR